MKVRNLKCPGCGVCVYEENNMRRIIHEKYV